VDKRSFFADVIQKITEPAKLAADTADGLATEPATTDIVAAPTASGGAAALATDIAGSVV
jgi:hypothetical protein